MYHERTSRIPIYPADSCADFAGRYLRAQPVSEGSNQTFGTWMDALNEAMKKLPPREREIVWGGIPFVWKESIAGAVTALTMDTSEKTPKLMELSMSKIVMGYSELQRALALDGHAVDVAPIEDVDAVCQRMQNQLIAAAKEYRVRTRAYLQGESQIR